MCTVLCGPWSATKGQYFEVSSEAKRSFKFQTRYFAWNSKKGDRRRRSLVSECGPCSVTQVSSTKKTERKNMIVSTRKRFFHNISCIFFYS